ncbi:hypothetical protein AMK06_CH01408 [Rhizobium sp. N541]|uniref:hypothetical protein n=1 Tax=unclassified Rhizobium TaxID=2613769 RepID=UPI0007F0ED98|nr:MULTISPECIES: hypothetical protein [unclassified Rhizobium]ANM16338.1 hypothetical protein AMK06_CH01408 [Rhizobium sp. N541]ANM22723.1 hypothetical protein AMK07_CH01405 [Rhizobium sp. N941]
MIDIEGWSGAGTQGAFAEFRANLAGHFYDDAGIEYRLFRSPGNHLHPATIWKVCAGIPEGNGYRRRPLLSGKLEARMRGTSSTAGSHRWNFTFRLALNPTRWVAQQPLSLLRLPEEQWADHPAHMFHRGQNYTDELPLVRSDNVHLGLPRVLSLARPSTWMIQVERYIRGVVTLLENTLGLAAGEATGFSIDTPEPSFTLKEIEAYWEYSTPRPLEEMRRLADPIRQLAASSSTAWHPLTEEASAALSAAGAIEIGTDDNSPRVLIRSGRGCDVRIYAKTDSRLRFEIAYDCNEARVLFQPVNGLSFEQLISRLAFGRQRGAEKFNELLGFIRPQMTVPQQERQIHELFTEIFRCALSPAKASTIVAMLVNNGRVVSGPDLGLPDIRRLTRRGVFMRGGTQGKDFTWVVTPPFEAALARLRNALGPS